MVSGIINSTLKISVDREGNRKGTLGNEHPKNDGAIHVQPLASKIGVSVYVVVATVAPQLCRSSGAGRHSHAGLICCCSDLMHD